MENSEHPTHTGTDSASGKTSDTASTAARAAAPVIQRRDWMTKAVAVSASAMAAGFIGRPALALSAESAQQAKAAESARQWRALSRLGYGPTDKLLQAISEAGDAQIWALQQMPLALEASRKPPSAPGDLQGIHSPLPDLFSGARSERLARATPGFVAPADAPAGSPGAEAAQRLRRLDFSQPPEPALFNQTQVSMAATWRLTAASQPELENPLLARMTEFWFNHFNIYANKGSVRTYVGHYLLNAIRANALGKFETLLLATARHPAMLLYLDQAQSVAAGRPGANGAVRGLNENYARELMELHTLGVDGGYTQNDVRNLARVLTGWTVGPNAPDGFRFVAANHDTESKTVLGRSYPTSLFQAGETEGTQAIHALASHPATAQRICLRLAQFFVADQPPPLLVHRLKTVFLESEGDVSQVMQVLLKSPDFWAPENRLFKMPLDYALSGLTAVGGGQDRRLLLASMGFLNNAGQPLHNWQTPDGYPTDAATWLAPEALTRRADYALLLGRAPANLDYLHSFLSEATLATVAREPAAMRNGLLLASPEFMYK